MTFESFWLTSIAVSSIVTALSNKAAKDTIRRNGYTVDYSNTTAFEKLNYFLTDYFFLCVPVYNLWKSIVTNKIKKKPSVYADERFETYKDRGVLKEVKEEPVKKAVPMFRKEEPTEELTSVVKEVKKVEKEKEKTPEAKQTVQPYNYGNMTSIDKLSYLKAIQKNQIEKYEEAEKTCSLPYSERKSMYEEILERHKTIKQLEMKKKREAEINRLKQERDSLTNNNEKKLELK